MLNECNLNQKSCVPCQGGVLPMEVEASMQLLKKLGHKWEINPKGHLYKIFVFEDFKGPVAFVNEIASLAEQEAHHPDLLLAWGKCCVEIWTHKIDGLTESDFILAAKIESLRHESGG